MRSVLLDAHATSSTFTDVTSYLAWDYHRLDAIRTQVARCAFGGRMAEARSAFAAFEGGLVRHIRLEEELVFPVFEARSGLDGGPTTAMRADHREIRRALALLGGALQAEDERAFAQALAFLRETLDPHVSREEHILFPTLDQLLTPAERARLAARLQEE